MVTSASYHSMWTVVMRTVVAAYLVLVAVTSVASSAAYGLDKRRASIGGRRVPERALRPQAAEKNRVPLDELNKSVGELMRKARDFALRSLELDVDVEDRADEDTLNRILGFADRGDR
jgi:hypothetical protein